MSWLTCFFRRADDSLEREIGFHIAEQTEANMARGMSPAEARRKALVDFGGREQVRQTVRFMRKSPSFSIAVIQLL